MATATHLIKIKGIFDDKKWTEERLRNFVNDKIKYNIDRIYHPDLELFQVGDTSVEVWVYICDLSQLKLLEKAIKDWLGNHIKEDGLTVDSIKVEKLCNGFYVIIP